MAPDLNSLPPSRSISDSPFQARAPDSPSLRSTSSRTAMASADRASNLPSRGGSPRLDRPSSRRHSSARFSLSLNEPALPTSHEIAPGEPRSTIGYSFSASSPMSLGGRGTIATGDPHHQRQPSLGDIHNELEQEQEAQVNRMLQLIRAQQLQLEAFQRQQQPDGDSTPPTGGPPSSIAVVDEPTPGSERSFNFHRSGNLSGNPYSANRSPALRPLPSHEGHTSSSEWPPSPSESLRRGSRRNSVRDDSAYYQAETANLTRENQMLKMRIRELEKQLSELSTQPAESYTIASDI